jgi:NAD(P)-dependent dehydrogenase (short-subunit alcohol dehydrogenase family)
MKIVVIDGQGGSIGREIAERLLRKTDKSSVYCIGTNSAATQNMIKSGAVNCATGENPVCVACRDADYIIGPIGIVLVDAMLGEITPAIASAVSNSPAHKILIPVNRCITVAGVEDKPMSSYIDMAVDSCLQ